MVADTFNFVNFCETSFTSLLKLTKIPLLAAHVPIAPNQKIAMDILGPIKGMQNLLTLVDHFSRHIELYYLNNIIARAVTKAFLHCIAIATHGRLKIVLSDQGSQFTSLL